MKASIFESGDEGKNPGNNDSKVNWRKQERARIYNPDGSYREIVHHDSVSLPDEQGNWRDYSLVANHLDDQGNPLPEDLKGVSVSHQGRLIPPDRIAVCSSPLHPPGLTRNIYTNVDGIVTEQGAICSTCIRRRTVFNITAIVVGICLLIGIVKGLGWF